MVINLLKSCTLALGLSLCATGVLATEAPIYTGTFSDVAVSGYDPVASFTEGQPRKGATKFATS